MSISKIQKGDNVKVISGNFKGITGVVTAVKKSKNTRKNTRVAVAGVNKIAKFQKANRQYNMPGSIKEVDRFLDVSNVSLVDNKGNLSKIKIEEKDGFTYRVYKTTKTKVEKTSNKKDLSVKKSKLDKSEK
jgi:large subunit ribosomal protein L24